MTLIKELQREVPETLLSYDPTVADVIIGYKNQQGANSL